MKLNRKFPFIENKRLPLALKKWVDDAVWLDSNQFVDPPLTDLKALGLLCDGTLKEKVLTWKYN